MAAHVRIVCFTLESACLIKRFISAVAFSPILERAIIPPWKDDGILTKEDLS